MKTCHSELAVPPQDEVEVMIAVGDLNDNSPMFSSETYSSTHAEGNENDLVVATVFATDRDGGSNGRVEYGIIGGNGDGVFYIDSDSVSRLDSTCVIFLLYL